MHIAKYAIFLSCKSIAAIAKNRLTTTVMLAARPSSPSVRFTAFTVPHTTNITNTT